LLAINTFLGVNDIEFIVPEAEAAAMILSLAAGEVSEDG
jgi:death-on-curing protein